MKKPWWNDSLQLLWAHARACEQKWLKNNSPSRQTYKAEFTKAQNMFDKEVKRCKQRFWFEQQ